MEMASQAVDTRMKGRIEVDASRYPRPTFSFSGWHFTEEVIMICGW
jgi:hypothetical protein